MTANAKAAKPANTNAPVKDLYEIGEIPPLGHVPEKMYAWASGRSGTARPDTAMQIEVVPTWTIDSDEVLVLVMAAGVNYNGVWAALGQPIRRFDGHKQPYHIAGSDASGIVWAVGAKVKRWKVGDEVVIHCNQDDGDDEECNGGDPMFSPLAAHLGLRDAGRLLRAVHPRAGAAADAAPQHLTWEEAACYTLTLATAYRMLFGHRPHVPEAGPERAGLGRVGRPRLDGDPAHHHGRRQCHRRDLGRGQARLRHGARRARA